MLIKEEKFIISLPTFAIFIFFWPDFTNFSILINRQEVSVRLYIFADTIKNHRLVLLPLPQSDPPSKQNLPSITPNLLSSFMGHVPSNLGGTPDTIQKVWSCR